MSRFRSKTKPHKGMVISSIWKYVVVSISVDSTNPDQYHVFEVQKFAALDKAQESIKEMTEFYRPRPNHCYAIAEWVVDDNGRCVCVLMEDPKLT